MLGPTAMKGAPHPARPKAKGTVNAQLICSMTPGHVSPNTRGRPPITPVSLVTFALMYVLDPLDLVFLALYFFMAYFMIASVMAAVGSAVSDIREANTLLTPVMMVLTVPLMLWWPIVHSPNGAFSTVVSFIPPAIPFAMILRLAADEPVPWWQTAATLVWGYVCVLAMVWMAAKIFRVGVLMYGKPPTPIQLLKWLRYS